MLIVHVQKPNKASLQDDSTHLSTTVTKIGLSLLQLSPHQSTLQFITEHRGRISSAGTFLRVGGAKMVATLSEGVTLKKLFSERGKISPTFCEGANFHYS